jgi:hypothetical protein
MGMTPDHFFNVLLDYIGERKRPFFFKEKDQKEDLEQHIPHFFPDMVRVTGCDGIEEFIGFFKKIDDQGFRGLFPVPRTLYPQCPDQFQQGPDRFWFLIVGVLHGYSDGFTVCFVCFDFEDVPGFDFPVAFEFPDGWGVTGFAGDLVTVAVPGFGADFSMGFTSALRDVSVCLTAVGGTPSLSHDFFATSSFELNSCRMPLDENRLMVSAIDDT